MLSDTTIAYLSTLSYRADAARRNCWLPLSGIYWEDEIPDFRRLRSLPDQDQYEIWRLFGIRLKIWSDATLSDDDQQFWDAARSLVPNFPLFQRLNPTPEELREQEEIEETAARELAAWFEDADQASITEDEHGMQHISVTFDLKKAERSHSKPQDPAEESSAVAVKKKSWWRRMLGR